ncbi:MAG: hypothetical protein AAB480_00955 [Patescibacteria group bacterium]
MVDAEEDRRWKIERRQSELQWADVKQRLDRRRKIDLLVGIPAIALFALLSLAIWDGWWAHHLVWTKLAMILSLGVMMTVQLWPRPEIRLGLYFHAEATRQIVLESRKAKK